MAACLVNLGHHCTHVTCTAYEMGDEQKVRHRFVGRSDRWCEVCKLPDRNPVHWMDPLQESEKQLNLHLNVYKATFEYVKREAGSDTYRLADVDPEETLVAAPNFGAACSLAEEVAKETLKNRRFTHLTEIRVRDVVLLHSEVRLHK